MSAIPSCGPPRAASAPRGVLATRLTRLSLAAAGLALLVAGLSLNVTTFFAKRSSLIDDATAQARVIASNAAAAVVFDDRTTAQETLKSLEFAPKVVRATLYDKQARVVADYSRLAAAPADSPSLPAEGVHADAQRIIVVGPVATNVGTAGWLRLEVPLRPLYREALAFGAMTLAAMAVALGLAWAFAVGVRRDVARVEQRLDDLAHRDPVTGLFNRHAANEHLARYDARPPNQATGYTVISIDLDDFKAINDTVGHEGGDDLLRHVARRLRETIAAEAQAYRFGGDEFMVLCPRAEGLREPERFAAMVRHALRGAIRIGGLNVTPSASVGVARYPLDGQSAMEVLQASDIAMYAAKRRGKNSVVVFDAGMRTATQERLRLEADLGEAIRCGQLFLLYQPIVDLRSGDLIGAEALVRWRHPIRGVVSPQEFIPLAEDCGLIVELGQWVLCEAAKTRRRWLEEGSDAVRVAVNVSARQLVDGKLLHQVSAAAEAIGGAWNRMGIDIELTERTLVEDIDENLRLLENLRKLGVGIAIDDFGTGLSSLSYLKQLPVDKLKIDRSFVDGLPAAAEDRAIVQAAVSMAHALGLKVVAEGVERKVQRQFLAGLGVEMGQGWLFGRPLPADDFQRLMRQGDKASAFAPLADEIEAMP